MTNNARRRIRTKEDLNTPSKKEKSVEKSRPASTATYNRFRPLIAKPAVAAPTDTPFAPTSSKDSKEGNCFICHKPEHVVRDCPNRNAKAAMLKELQMESSSEDDSHSEN